MDSITLNSEEEARKKYCPFSMNAIPISKCLGSACMAWEHSYYIEQHKLGYCKLIEAKSNGN